MPHDCRDRRFEDRMSELELAIAALPPEARGALERLVAETRDRHAETTASIRCAHDGLAAWEACATMHALQLSVLADAARRLRPDA